MQFPCFELFRPVYGAEFTPHAFHPRYNIQEVIISDYDTRFPMSSPKTPTVITRKLVAEGQVELSSTANFLKSSTKDFPSTMASISTVERKAVVIFVTLGRTALLSEEYSV